MLGMSIGPDGRITAAAEQLVPCLINLPTRLVNYGPNEIQFERGTGRAGAKMGAIGGAQREY